METGVGGREQVSDKALGSPTAGEKMRREKQSGAAQEWPVKQEGK